MISLAFAIVVTTICEIDGTILTRIFTNNQDVIKNGALYLKTYSIDCLLTSFLFCINGYLNGYEKTVFTMVHSLVATFIGRIPLTLLFSKISKRNTIPYGNCCSIIYNDFFSNDLYLF